MCGLSGFAAHLLSPGTINYFVQVVCDVASHRACVGAGSHRNGAVRVAGGH
ncbi:uncharacterized protein AFUA_8G04450 [Aspergillus fumigatus Af293]|uniref:Uncharacterized protein n=2 Tax=Aspergillus fumigatus TaxID=746128 RepID=Q4WCH0_ASPFU|nr:hypothetical protein AFUA_8G04450 [Aspergillus fumigatus Af293]EAL85214.1 hypothetical protein AFUA_8G04450 [Aspergillus fumigatus Af293]EDP48861.1 hypothetical protein AFUB_083090 [Aspergillus fumigatus A1163]